MRSAPPEAPQGQSPGAAAAPAPVRSEGRGSGGSAPRGDSFRGPRTSRPPEPCGASETAPLGFAAPGVRCRRAPGLGSAWSTARGSCARWGQRLCDVPTNSEWAGIRQEHGLVFPGPGGPWEPQAPAAPCERVVSATRSGADQPSCPAWCGQPGGPAQPRGSASPLVPQ